MAVDYHDKNLTIRRFNCHTGEERILKRPTTAEHICRLIDTAVSEASQVGGRVIWIMESTTGWARVKRLIGSRATFIVANVLQMPLPPKAYRRYLAHETWEARTGLWSNIGMRRLRKLAASTREPDKTVLTIKLTELEQLERLLKTSEKSIIRIYQHWRQAQWLGQIFGIAQISAVSILARIWPIKRFASAEELISYAGLAPGIRESDQTLRVGHIGGGGTDKHFRAWTRYRRLNCGNGKGTNCRKGYALTCVE